MALINVDSSTGALVATGSDGVAESIVIVQDGADNDFSNIKNIQTKEEYANISNATIADTLTTDSPIVDGDNLIIVLADNSVNEVVASGVTGSGPYSMDTTPVTAGEIPTAVYTVDSKISFDDTSGYVEATKLTDSYISSYASNSDLTNGLISYFLLNNNGDNATDSYYAIESANVTFDGEKATLASDIPDNLNCGSLIQIGDGDFSVSCWVKFDVIGAYQAIFSQGIDSTYVKIVKAGTDVIVLYIGDGTTLDVLVHSETIITNKWYHIVAKVNSITMSININGAIETDSNSTTSLCKHPTEPLYLGNDNGLGNYLNGSMSNVRLYNIEVTTEDEVALYNEGYYPKPLPLPATDGLTAHYPLTGTTEDTVGNNDGVEVSGGYINTQMYGGAFQRGVDADNITISENPLEGATAVTISMWVYIPVSSTGAEGLFSLKTESGSTTWCNIDIANSYVNLCGLFSGGFDFDFIYGAWNFLVFKTDNTTLKIYRNNALNTTYTQSGTFESPIGLDATTRYLVGDLGLDSLTSYTLTRNIRFYSREITLEEQSVIYNYEKNFRPIDITDGLIAYYPLATNSLDNYYNEFDGTDTGITYDGQSAEFADTTDIISIDASLAFGDGDFTFACWVKINPDTKTQRFFAKGSASEYIFFNILDTNFLQFGCHDGATGYSHVTTTVSIIDDVWTHVSFKREGSLFSVSLDMGEPETDTDTTTHQNNDVTENMYLGNSTSNAFYLNGFMANVRFYNKVLSAEQINVIYDEENVNDHIAPGESSLTNTRTYDDLVATGRSIATKIQLKSTGDTCTEVSADIWKLP